MRETTKQIVFTVGGEEKTFQLRKMNALAGTYMVKFCAEKLLPLYKSLQSVFSSSDTSIEGLSEEEIKAKEEKAIAERTDKLLVLIPEALSHLPEDELMIFETRCLQTVDVLKKAGWQPVMVGNSFGDEELEYDVSAVLRLVYEVLVFNLGSFFGGGSLLSLLNRKDSSPQNA